MIPKVSIVVLNYNGLEDTIECLESLRYVTYPNYEVILVDNGSKGDDAKVLKDRFDGVVYVENSYNAGFTGGNNMGILCALANKADYIILLNNDTKVAPDFVTELVKVAEVYPSVGAVVAKICLYDKPGRIESTGLGVDMWRGQSFRLNYMKKDNGRFNQIREVDAASTNAFLIPSVVIVDVGRFDEDFFIYHDDVDYCIRLWDAGYKVLYAPKAKIWHKVGKAAKKVSGFPYYYLAKNNFRFMRKHATWWQYRCFLCYFFGFHLWFMMAVYLLYFRSFGVVDGYYKGVLDGVFNSDIRKVTL